ncbi:DUF2625 family protein [Nocardia sp. NPDC127579]|uniref:DUF2625 family protein n=1 Tax=Nocardia sp. NPDC127579 TaxID=3345402 RepID=UPI00363FA646
MKLRTFDELADVDDPAWPDLQDDLATATVSVAVLPVEARRAQETLRRLQVTARSTLGALALHTGGLLLDQGWLRMLGGGHSELPDIATMSEIGAQHDSGVPPSLVVALDVLGGQFVINGGGLPANPGDVCYLMPDSLTWESTGFGHSAFVMWALNGGLADLYGGLRWPGWVDEVRPLSPGQGLSIYPPLWSAEGDDISATSRTTCPLTELTRLHRDVALQFDDRTRSAPAKSEPKRFWRRR